MTRIRGCTVFHYEFPFSRMFGNEAALAKLVRAEWGFHNLGLSLLQLPDVCHRVLDFIVRDQGANYYPAVIAFTAIQLRHSSGSSLGRPRIWIAGAWLKAGDVSCL